MRAHVRSLTCGLPLIGAILTCPTPAFADLRLCNRTSYVLDLAIALEDKGATATRGWFRVDPGQCRGVLAGAIEADGIYVYARALPIYAGSPLPQDGQKELCVADGNFVIAGASACTSRNGQRLARFTAVSPTQTNEGLSAHIAEEADYDDEQARLAGIQRLLVIAGYDATPIDGIAGAKTEAALAQFLKDRKLAADVPAGTAFFDLLVDTVRQASDTGFSWCNDTSLTVMAALGLEDHDTVVTRGWYRVEPGACLRPDVSGRPRRVFSFGEAVDQDGQAVRRADKPLSWGGTTMLCTREARFELTDQGDCVAKGLNATGFASVDLIGRATTVRFKEP
jgi:uncharacterized membrane protein